MTNRAVHRQVLALIPARGGSKGIPRKNIISIAGRPLIAYTIEQAQRSQHINRVIVTTDDEEIAAVSRSFGAEVPFLRPGAFAQDLSPDIDVFRHALGWLQGHEGYAPELIVHLRPTGPVRRVELIDQASYPCGIRQKLRGPRVQVRLGFCARRSHRPMTGQLRLATE